MKIIFKKTLSVLNRFLDFQINLRPIIYEKIIKPLNYSKNEKIIELYFLKIHPELKHFNFMREPRHQYKCRKLFLKNKKEVVYLICASSLEFEQLSEESNNFSYHVLKFNPTTKLVSEIRVFKAIEIEELFLYVDMFYDVNLY